MDLTESTMIRDVWAVGDAYEAYVGRWSRPVAAAFLRWLGVPPGRTWLDVGCGTGALTAAVLARTDPRWVLGVDPSEGFLAMARAATADGRSRFCAGDARALPLSEGKVDALVSGLAVNFVPDPVRAATEFRRVVAPGGTVAAYVWDYAEGMGMLRHFWDCAAALDPRAGELDEGHRFPLCRPGPLAALWQEAGLEHVMVQPVDVPTVFSDFDDYWMPFLGGQGPAPAYVATLPDGPREALRDLLRTRLPAEPDGSIRLVARAWAVKGRVK